MRRYLKTDVEIHGDRGPARPAVRIKVYGNWRSVTLPLELGTCDGERVTTPAGFTREWVEARPDAELQAFWDMACEVAVEDLISSAREEFGPGVTVYQAGRSGGWLEVEGLPSLESWDAVRVAKWGRWERFCRATAQDLPRAFLHNLYTNAFEVGITLKGS